MVRLSPRFLIATASAFIGLGATPQDSAPGSLIENFRATVSQHCKAARDTWAVPLIQHCGYLAHYDERSRLSAWPVPRARSAEELGAIGGTLQVLYEQPIEGDLFLMYQPRQQRFVHAGIVTAVLARGRYSRLSPYVDIASIEGDTDHQGRMGGGMAMRMTRRLSHASGDRFFRWTELATHHQQMARTALLSRRSA